MRPSFNTSGPCIPGQHYMLPPERRLGHVLALIEDHRYFTLHAGRQTGKTTSARWRVEHFNRGDRFRALWVDIQDARELNDPARAFELVLDDLDLRKEPSWDEKITHRDVEHRGKRVHVVGC